MKIDYEIKVETPVNIKELVRMAGDKSSWRIRLAAVNEIKKWDCQQSRDVITRLAIHDLVFKVREEALKVAQAFRITKNGQPIHLNRKPKGNLIKDINKKIYRVVDSLKDEFDLVIFKEKFKQMYPEPYDVYEFEKGNKFDEWIINIVKSKPQK